MSTQRRFALTRWWSVVLKEFIQLRRDRLTFGMVIGIPILQLTLFGFAINSDPRHMPTAIHDMDRSDLSRSIAQAMENSEYFRFVRTLDRAGTGRELLARGEVQFVLTIPSGFSRDVLRGERPAVLVEADATDPMATGLALTTLPHLVATVARKDLQGAAVKPTTAIAPFEFRVHPLYNPEGITRYNIIPGLMGVILALSMVLLTGLAITRERERGTMENMLAMPLQPIEVITGKLVPYIAIGLIQVTIIFLAALYVFQVPFAGDLPILYAAAMLFVVANLAVGISMSSLAKNQLQAMQMTMFYFLPNILLSGFMFPFQGMPEWAQAIGRILPLTYFNRLARGIFLKGSGWLELWPNIWPLIVFTLVMLVVATRFYRKTLD